MTPLPETTCSRRAAWRGFTIPEVLISITLLVLVSGGMLGAYVFGIRLYLMADAKLDTNSDIRDLEFLLAHDVRTAADFDIGTGSATTFTKVADAQPRQGNALQIYPTASTNIWVRYFLDLSDQTLKVVDNTDSNAVSVADSVTNTVPFTAEDFRGNITANDQPKEVVGLFLQFNQVVLKRKVSGQTVSDQGDVTDYFEVRTRFNTRNDLGYQC